MLVLVLGLVLFLGVHSVRIVRPELREGVISRRGEGVWMWSYTALSVVGLALIVWGYGLARQLPVILYAPSTGLQHLTLLLMLPVFPLLFAAYMPGRIRGAVGHPMLLATVLWGGAHLLANGTLADLFLFGGFTGWAALAWVSSVRRPRKPVVSRPPSPVNDAIAVALGLVVYGAFLGGLHQLITGVSLL